MTLPERRKTIFPLSTLLIGVFFDPSPALSNAIQPESLRSFRVHGRLFYEVYLPTGTNSNWTRDFSISISSSNWVIESFDKLNNQAEISARLDGVNYYASRVNLSKNPTLNDYTVVVEDNEVPPSSVSGSSVLWLAFASDNYFKSVTNNQYQPVWMLDDRTLRKEKYAVEGILETMEAGLPKHLIYLNPGILYARASGQRAIVRAPASFKGSITNAIYRTIETTNLGNGIIPLSFQFERFGIQPDFTTYLLSRITGRVNSIEPDVQASDISPTLKGTMFVIDKRFENNKPALSGFTYMTTNMAFPKTKSDVVTKQKQLALKNQAAIKHKKPNYPTQTKKHIVVIVLSAFFALPLVWLVYKHFSVSRKTNN